MTSLPAARAREAEQYGRGVVVHYQGRLGAGEPVQQVGNVLLARSTAAGVKV